MKTRDEQLNDLHGKLSEKIIHEVIDWDDLGGESDVFGPPEIMERYYKGELLNN